MFEIIGTDIIMTRGDTLPISITVKRKDGAAYSPNEGDRFRFALKRKLGDPDTDVKILKEISPYTLRFTLLPADTKPLVRDYPYEYDIEYTDTSGQVDTFIEGTLTVKGDVL